MGFKFMQLLGSYDIGEKFLLGAEKSILIEVEAILDHEYNEVH